MNAPPKKRGAVLTAPQSFKSPGAYSVCAHSATAPVKSDFLDFMLRPSLASFLRSFPTFSPEGPAQLTHKPKLEVKQEYEIV